MLPRRQPMGWNGGCRLRGLGDRAEPVDRGIVGAHGPQPRIAPEMACEVFQLEDVDRVPALPQSMRAGGNPEGGRDVFHERILLYICTVFSSRIPPCLRPKIQPPPPITH